MLVTMSEMLKQAQNANYAVPAPNVWNEDSVRACIRAAEECKSPVILDGSYHASLGDMAPQKMYEEMLFMVPMAERASVPVVINLDHGKEFEHVMLAIRMGYTSVMIDRSASPFDENVDTVKRVCDVAHAVGVSVEAELGHVGYGSNYAVDGISNLTDPEDAVRFVELTGVDCLAVAVGSAHGPYKGKPNIDFDRLAAIRQAVNVPLVMHGGSGTGDDNLYKAARCGINKVNLYTDLVTAGMERLRSFDIQVEYDFSKAEAEAYAGYGKKLMSYMELLGSKGKA
ncbi:class II fructose-bisphosphate aldolase [Eubacteriales bacterium OttesenSCG-928-N14]|nr:class II fructose-bisphosphate aldolase [Eubacteriales bacterium OttesenSCG-928-N14]